MKDNPVCVLAETEIVELDGKTISVPVRLVERYAPKQSFYIEGHDLPSIFLDYKLHEINRCSWYCQPNCVSWFLIAEPPSGNWQNPW